MDCSCAPVLQFFSVASDVTTTERQIQNHAFWSISYQFEQGQHRQLCINLDTVFDIYYGTRCTLQRTKHFADPSVGDATRFTKFAVEILQSLNNRMQSLWEILCMVITDIVINIILGRLTQDNRYALSFMGRCFRFQLLLSSMGRIVCGETSMGPNVYGAKCTSMGLRVHRVKCLWGEKSINLLGQND